MNLKTCPKCSELIDAEAVYCLHCGTKQPLPLEKPEVLGVYDFSTVITYCRGYIEDLDRDGYVDEDTKHYIFEAAMTAVYGKDVWKYINKRQG